MKRSLSSSDAREQSIVAAVNTSDLISKLPNDLLVKILSRLSIKEAVRTSGLSNRWVDVWKEMSHLFLDLRNLATVRTILPHATDHHAARSMNKVINDHHGPLKKCRIFYYSHQCEDGMVEAWIRSLIHVKHINCLTLINFRCPNRPCSGHITLDLPPESFSHPDLKSLLLGRYNIKTPHAFDNCWNLKKLELTDILAEVGVFNAVFNYCPSLEVLVIVITCHELSGILKIENPKLKFLFLSCYVIDGIEVTSPNLDILTIEVLSCEIENVVITNPRLQFHRNSQRWSTKTSYCHTSYSISCPDQEKKSIGHEFMMRRSRDFMTEFASMWVSVDLENTKEVEMLQEILAAWPGEMEELEILFKKSNAPRKEAETYIGRTQKKFWEERKPSAIAHIVCLSNFSGSNEEFMFASRLITQGMVIQTMIIKPSSFSPSNKLEIEGAVANLKELRKGHRELDIIMVW